MTVRTRFAPSPTGYLHIGGARTALFSWLYARANGGEFILRIEDTDRERSTEASVQAILDGMQWLNLDYDEGPFYQTDRMDRYAEVIQTLLDQGDAYHCYCSKQELDELRAQQMAAKQKPRYDGRYRDFTGSPPGGIKPVIRFRNPLQGSVVIEDQVKGRVEIQNSELDDLIIARSDGSPTYNLTVVVDDMDMNITHVVRGDDHLNNTPRQMNILKALGQPAPVYAHVPMILGEDGKRLSKRHGAVSVMQYAEDGFLPEALINYLVRLGWSHGDQELFTRQQMIDLFSLQGINRAASTFSPKKLQWLNEQYLKTTDSAEIAKLIVKQLQAQGVDTGEGPNPEAVVVALRERSKGINDMAVAAKWFYQPPEEYDEKARKKQFTAQTAEVLEGFKNRISALADWEQDPLKQAVSAHADALGLKMGQVGMPLRIALTGGTNSPDIGLTLQLIGRDSAIERLTKAVDFIQCQ